MVCKNCGTMCGGEDKFCRHCGRKLTPWGTEEEWEEMCSNPISWEETLAHFGYEHIEGVDFFILLKKESQLDRLVALPDVVRARMDGESKYHLTITFDYDPDFPRMLLRFSDSASSR